MPSRTFYVIICGFARKFTKKKKLSGHGSTVFFGFFLFVFFLSFFFFLSVAMASTVKSSAVRCAKPAVMEQGIFRGCLKCINSKRFIFYGHSFYEYLIYVVCQHQTMTNES